MITSETMIPWALFSLYVLAIAGLTWWNRRKTSSLQAFAVGTRTIPPVFVGLSLAANMTSVATFVINPGLIYAYGWAGVVGYGIAAPLGIFLGLVVMSKRFRQIGDSYTVITVPQWLGERYGDRRLTVFFALASLLQVTFLVLIVTALALVLQHVLAVPLIAALVFVVAFTFGYIRLGGASVHVWSNVVQALIMIVVAALLIVSGASLFGGGVAGFFARLAEVGPHYASVTNPNSLLFRDVFEVIVANFSIGVAIIMQPHIISKALYLRSERDVNVYLATAVIVGTLFTAVLLTGLYARLTLDGPLPPDHVIPTYIVTTFAPTVRAVIMLGVLAAGFSTLEGVALALSSIFAADFYGTLARLAGVPEEEVRGRLLRVGRLFLVALAPLTLVLAWWQAVRPSLSVAIFTQNGVYALFAATFAPVAFGVFSRRLTAPWALASAATALVVHFGMFYGKITAYHTNPAVPATCALAASLAVAATGVVRAKGRGDARQAGASD